MKQTYLLSTLLTITLIFQSCKEDKKVPPFEENLVIKEASLGMVANTEEAYIAKYNAYIAVWNDVSSRVEQTFAVINTSIDEKTGKPLDKKDTYFIPSLIESRAIVILSDKINEKPKIEELDALAPDLISSYKELLDPLQELSEYYKLASYKEDDFKKGSELYFKVREPLEKFMATSDILGVRLQEIDIKLSTENLAEFKAQDLLLLYNKGMIINSLKEHSIPLYNIKYDEYQNLDLDAYDKHLEDIISYYEAFKSLATDKERVKKEMNTDNLTPFSNYYLTIDTYIEDAKNLKELIQDDKKYEAMKITTERYGINFDMASHVKVTTSGEKVISSSNALNR